MDALLSCKLAVQWVRQKNLCSSKIYSFKLAVDQANINPHVSSSIVQQNCDKETQNEQDLKKINTKIKSKIKSKIQPKERSKQNLLLGIEPQANLKVKQSSPGSVTNVRNLRSSKKVKT